MSRKKQDENENVDPQVAPEQDGEAQEDEALTPEEEQAQREEARRNAGQANQDQQGAPAVEGTPQPDTQHFQTQADVLNPQQPNQ